MNMSGDNRGSAIIEVTIMIPIILGCLYLYIMSMLFITKHGRMADELSAQLYSNQDDNGLAVGSDGKIEETKDKQGQVEVIKYEGVIDKYDVRFELKKCSDDPVKNLRRWQLVADTIR